MSEGYQALRHGAAIIALSSRGRIQATGRDRVRFLHNITSNDVKKLTAGAGCYAFLLTPQGRIQGDLVLLAFEDHFLIDTEPELLEKLLAYIRRYIIADQVVLADVTGSSAELALEGPGAAAILASLDIPVPGADYRHLPWGDWTVAQISLSGQAGFRFIGPADAAPVLEAQLTAAGARLASDADVRLVRIENGRPRYGEDILETSLPQETGQMHAVSFTKGCYLGQEIVERIRARGHVNKKLVRLEIAASEPVAPGSKLSANGTEAGEVTSSVYSPESGKVAALAYVRTPHAEPGASLDAGGAAAVVMSDRS
jgi:folate-binding protein YgfZ